MLFRCVFREAAADELPVDPRFAGVLVLLAPPVELDFFGGTDFLMSMVVMGAATAPPGARMDD